MESALVNLVEPSDRVIVGINGIFGGRMAAILERSGSVPLRIERPWGQSIEPDAIEQALKQGGRIKAVALVHAETSTGVEQSLAEIGRLCRQYDCLFIVDAVTSLGGTRLEVDAWQIDVCYSGSQKCLSCPPGLAPLTMNERAVRAVRNRSRPCQSWYLDLSLIEDYWTSQRAYHHTAPISMLYALREALRLVREEGLGSRLARHRRNSEALMAGLEALGLPAFAQEGCRLPTLNCVSIPPQLDEQAIRQALLEDYGIEIGGGLGPLRGGVWRVGLMGESSTQHNVMALLSALEILLSDQGASGGRAGAVDAARQVYVEARRRLDPRSAQRGAP